MGSIRTGVLSGVLTLCLAAAALANGDHEHMQSGHLVDLTSEHWCHSCVVKVIDDHQVMSGFYDHTFRGDWKVNRYELAAAVAKTWNYIKLTKNLDLPSPSDGKSRPIGVLPDHWAYHYVRKLAEENGLLAKMIVNGNYEGERELTREELAYGLSEFLQQMEMGMNRSLEPQRREAQLAIDLPRGGDYRAHIDMALNRYQFMNLHSDHTFRPNRSVTRYELAAALCKVFDLFDLPKPESHQAASH